MRVVLSGDNNATWLPLHYSYLLSVVVCLSVVMGLPQMSFTLLTDSDARI